MRVLELLGERPLAAGPAARLQRFEAALASYHAGDLATTVAGFEALLAETPDDHPVAIWLERCRERLAEAGGRAAPVATAGRGPYAAS